MNLTPRQRIRRRLLRRDGLGRQGALLLKQRRRIRNRCWQLLLCRFLRGQRRLDLQPRLPRPRRNQCAPERVFSKFVPNKNVIKISVFVLPVKSEAAVPKISMYA